MSKRDLQDDKKWLEQLMPKVTPNDVDRIAAHAIDRAIAAEKRVEELEKERNHYFKLVQSATADNERLRQEFHHAPSK